MTDTPDTAAMAGLTVDLSIRLVVVAVSRVSAMPPLTGVADFVNPEIQYSDDL